MLRQIKKSFLIFFPLLLTGVSILNLQSKGDTLYPAGRGKYGGDAYQDSSGTYWDRDTRYGRGKYGGGDYTDDKGNTIYCDTYGKCTSY